MFSFFKHTTPVKSNSNQPTTRGFTNQETILNAVNAPSSENGICSSLANLYTRYQRNEGSRSFMDGTPQDIYQSSVNERNRQVELSDIGLDGMHSAFADSQSQYSIITMDKKKIQSGDISNLVTQSPHSLLTYRVNDGNNERRFHQVAFGKNKTGDCYSFSANFNGGEKIHPCDQFNDIVSEMKATIHPDAQHVVIASDSYRPCFK